MAGKERSKKTAKIEEVRKFLGTKRLIIGADRTMKGLRSGKLLRVYLASNVSEPAKRDIEYYCGLAGVELVLLDKSNEDLGAFCKKPYKIAVLSITKQ